MNWEPSAIAMYVRKELGIDPTTCFRSEMDRYMDRVEQLQGLDQWAPQSLPEELRQDNQTKN